MRKPLPWEIQEETTPSLVSATDASNGWAINYPKQRKVFFMADRLWVFYSDGKDAVFRSSVDGIHWNPPTLFGSLPPGGLVHTCSLCKQLRARYPELKIIVGRWGLRDDMDTNRKQLQAAGADLMATTLLETRNQLNDWLPVLAHETENLSRQDTCKFTELLP